MAIKPVVRYMLLCEDWRLEPAASRRIVIYGLLTSIRPHTPHYPFVQPQLCVFLSLTDGYGRAEAKVVCRDDETERPVFETRPQTVAFGPDPSAVGAVSFRMRDCFFPKSGMYTVQFWYDGELLESRPLRLR